jgi:hypothetical protein
MDRERARTSLGRNKQEQAPRQEQQKTKTRRLSPHDTTRSHLDQMQGCFVRALPRRIKINAPLVRLLHATQARPAQVAKLQSALEKRIAAIPIDRFRNFCIVAHVDHGKSTLSDRLLELTGVIEKGGNAQSLDRLDVERERGITVKAQTCTMLYNHNGLDYMLHLVDTPGHVDFRAEVSRSYASCGGGQSP